MRWNRLAGISVSDSVIIIDIILRRSQEGGEQLIITVETMLITQSNNSVCIELSELRVA